MSNLSQSSSVNDVPTQVFEKFLNALSQANLSPELVDRLRKTLLEDKRYTERALKAAIMEEEPL